MTGCTVRTPPLSPQCGREPVAEHTSVCVHEHLGTYPRCVEHAEPQQRFCGICRQIDGHECPTRLLEVATL